jgi:pyruvate ferredoxin oxidoreductase delta subunit
LARKRRKSETGHPAELKSEIPFTTNFHSNEDWKFEKPVWDKEKCIQCGVCYLFCPDGAIRQDSDGYYEADLTYCKGCGICSVQCWTHCITMEEAVKRFPWLIKI